MKAWPHGALLIALAIPAQAQQSPPPSSVAELERRLDQALGDIKNLSSTIASMRSELDSLKRGALPSGNTAELVSGNAQGQTPSESGVADELADRIIAPDLGGDERDHAVGAMPEIFMQTRYSVAPQEGSEGAFDPNFRLSRIETRWSGKVADRMGAGLEIQYHAALAGAPEEVVNDAFLEYYVNSRTTVRAGQFVKPFGFDIQQSSSVRESPERAIFAGYFFPGQRDRGVLLSGDLGFLSTPVFSSLQYFAGVFNGNRFFDDNNRQVNYVFRLRKIFDKRFAIGASVQLANQILPAGVSGNNNENVYGLDFQFTAGRFGMRGEAVTGNMPSTSMSIEPEFLPAFRPGAHSTGAALMVTYQLTPRNNVYARYNQFNGDPVTGKNVWAANLGYFRPIGRFSRLSFDYQYKNRPSFEDDAVNGMFQITWQLVLGEPSEETSGKAQ